MKFGQLHLFEHPRGRTENEIIEEQMDIVVKAEEFDFDSVWLAEHHFREYGYCSTPAVMLAAVAARTKRIRLGTGVVVLPLNHPVRVAEDYAMLDHLSNGRLDLGVGRGYQPHEFQGFHVDQSRSRDMFRESVEIIQKAWTEDTFSYDGEFYQCEELSVRPKPLQQPHPPLWLACIQPETATLAGQKGLGALLMTFMGPEPVAERVDLYRKALQNAEPVGAEVNDRLALFAFAFCGERDAETRELAGPEALWYRETLGEIFSREWERHDTVPDSYQYHARVHSRGEQARRGDYNSYIDSGAFCMGDPDACIRIIERYAALKPEQFVMIMQVGNLPHEKIMESIRLFGKHVLPEFKRR